MEGNKGFEHCSDVLKKKGAWFVQQKDNVRPENCQLAVWTDIVLLPLHPWGEMIRMDRENNPPTAVLTSELMKSIGIMASFWGPKKTPRTRHTGSNSPYPSIGGGVFWRGFLANGIYLPTLGSLRNHFSLGSLRDTCFLNYMYMMGHSFFGGYLGWVLHYPKVVYMAYIYMATVVKPWKNQTKTVGWIGSTNPFYIGFIILYQAIIRREYTTHSHPEASSEMECAICVYIGFLILSQGMK